MVQVLTRVDFNRACLERDEFRCKLCIVKEPLENLSVHHIIERKLWEDGGYYKDNGITVCPACHIQVEAGFVLPQKLWKTIGVKVDKAPLPDGFNNNDLIDKWGQKIVWFDEEDQSFIVVPNQFEDKFVKAVRLAGGVVRPTTPEWLKEYLGIEVNEKTLYIGRLRK